MDDRTNIAFVKIVGWPIFDQRNDVMFLHHRLLNVTRDESGLFVRSFDEPDRAHEPGAMRPERDEPHFELLPEWTRLSRLDIDMGRGVEKLRLQQFVIRTGNPKEPHEQLRVMPSRRVVGIQHVVDKLRIGDDGAVPMRQEHERTG